MAFEQLPLPYDYDALEPYISEETMHSHFDRHHRGYVEKLSALTAGTEFEHRHLMEVIHQTQGVTGHEAIFNNAAQAWNHTFFWTSMLPSEEASPLPAEPEVANLIEKDFGSFENFRTAFIDASASHFGSGYTWLVLNGRSLQIVTTSNAQTPLDGRTVPLLNCDLWEHAYYLDYQNRRADFVAVFLDKLVNWNGAKLRFLAPDPSVLANVA